MALGVGTDFMTAVPMIVIGALSGSLTLLADAMRRSLLTLLELFAFLIVAAHPPRAATLRPGGRADEEGRRQGCGETDQARGQGVCSMTKPHLKLLSNRDILIWREDGWQKWGYVTVLGYVRKYGRGGSTPVEPSDAGHPHWFS